MKRILISWDMDSCLIAEESLDAIILSKLKPYQTSLFSKTLERETARAMEGSAVLSETIPRRISLAREMGVVLSREDFLRYGRRLQVISSLRRYWRNFLHSLPASIEVVMAVVSGGPQEVVRYTAAQLQIPNRYAFGNHIHLYEGFVEDTSVIVNDKNEILAPLKEPLNIDFHFHVGDGKTDMEVKADTIIRACWVVDRNLSSYDALPHIFRAESPREAFQIMKKVIFS